VHGHPAVGVSLPEVTTARLEDNPGPAWNLDSIPPSEREPVRSAFTFIEGLLPGLAARSRCSLRIESGVTRGAGFGSSAALCGALARAALAHAGSDTGTSVEAAWRLAHSAEKIFHGTPSGIDTGLALLGGTCVFEPHPPALPSWVRVEHPPIWLVVGAVPRDAACGDLVAEVTHRVAVGDAEACACIDTLGGLAAAAASALQSATGDLPGRIGHLADDAMTALCRLGLSTSDLDKVLDAGRAAGARGGKLSGAGAGGAFYLVAPEKDSAGRIAERVQSGCKALTFVSPLRVLCVGGAVS
jgi:mevalonate kinase